MASTIAARFVKCIHCHVNIPKDDIEKLDVCPVCKVQIDQSILSNDFSIPNSLNAATATPMLKRWVEVNTIKGKTYYHNTETGQDTWEKPNDFEAMPTATAFVPLEQENEVKKAILDAQNRQ